MRRLAALALAALALGLPSGAAAFDNTEPLAAQEWYLELDNAWAFWPAVPTLAPVRVAVIDSGIDGSQPDLAGQVVAAKSFVGGSPLTDEDGHGTFVAGEIAASPFNRLGMAGLAFNAKLMVAKVVKPDGTVSLAGEVAAIRWAVDNGAQVINLSLGGIRDPFDKDVDTYSPHEASAIAYAVSRGVVVVAALGNGPQSPATPWSFAQCPAALPHVIGVSAIRRDGSVPAYSNRDSVYNDLAAPGEGIFSTIPRSLVQLGAGCAGLPYSNCGPPEFREAIGTSFAAPQVTAAAALLLGQNPALTPDQVSWLLERSADDETAATGCLECPAGRDAYTGWGRLDVARALALLSSGTPPLPPPDRYEPNDDAGPWSHALPPLPRTVRASLDYWDDQVDVYRVRLRKGARVFARLNAAAADVRLSLWRPGTRHVDGIDAQFARRLVRSHRVGSQARLSFRAPRAGVYYLELKLLTQTEEPVRYRLSVARA